MRIGVARETAPGERRVALVPETAGKLANAGFEVVVEAGAGDAASFPDAAYTAAGATIGDAWTADALLKVHKPDEAEISRLRDGQLLVAYLDPLADPAGVRTRLARRDRVRDGVDPADDARAVDGRALLAGDRRRLQGRAARGREPPPLLPDAHDRRGHRPPAKVFVIGAGVAGLQAIATARRLGAVVTGFDVRPVVREQIESLGANWLDLGLASG